MPALAWGEKDGTVTDSERMIRRQRALFAAPGEARGDWRMIADDWLPAGARLEVTDQACGMRRVAVGDTGTSRESCRPAITPMLTQLAGLAVAS